MTFTSDATSGKGIPQNSTEWTGVTPGINPPKSLWLMQNPTSSPIVDQIGTRNLGVTGTPGFNQAYSGWSSKSIHFVEVDSSSLSSTDSTLPDPSTTSIMILAYIASNTNLGSVQEMYYAYGTSDQLRVELNGSGSGAGLNTARANDNSGHVDGTYNYNDGLAASSVHPILIQYNITAGTTTFYSDVEKLTVPYSVLSSTKRISFGAGVTTPSTELNLLYACYWSGADAEVSATVVHNLLLALHWSPTWSVGASGSLSATMAMVLAGTGTVQSSGSAIGSASQQLPSSLVASGRVLVRGTASLTSRMALSGQGLVNFVSSTTYTLPIAGTFQGTVEPTQLTAEIGRASSITSTLSYMTLGGGFITFVFATPLTALSYSALLSVLYAHIPDDRALTPINHIATFPTSLRVGQTYYVPDDAVALSCNACYVGGILKNYGLIRGLN